MARGPKRIYEMHHDDKYIGTGTLYELADMIGKSFGYVRNRIEGECADSVNYMFWDVTDKVEYAVYRGDQLLMIATKPQIMEQFGLSSKYFSFRSCKTIREKQRGLWIMPLEYEQLMCAVFE